MKNKKNKKIAIHPFVGEEICLLNWAQQDPIHTTQPNPTQPNPMSKGCMFFAFFFLFIYIYI